MISQELVESMIWQATDHRKSELGGLDMVFTENKPYKTTCLSEN